jgi:hypothetical protein
MGWLAYVVTLQHTCTKCLYLDYIFLTVNIGCYGITLWVTNGLPACSHVRNQA